MPRKPDENRTQLSATVPATLKQRIADRAVDEDRGDSAIVTRALDVYLSLPVDEAERMVRQARNTDPPDEMGG